MFQRYNDDFESIPSPGYLREYITHWGEDHVNHGETDNTTDAFTGKITSPKNVYSHNYTTANNGKTGYFCLGRNNPSFGCSGYVKRDNYCEFEGQWDCVNAGSIGCFCGPGYNCGAFEYVGYCN